MGTFFTDFNKVSEEPHWTIELNMKHIVLNNVKLHEFGYIFTILKIILFVSSEGMSAC